MTTGQRIAAKRKEQNLSQEGLGEVLGVSRQSIYKWESDTSLPEIDKLVTMSRLFQVSVGWLLGVEEEPEAQTGDRLSDAQLKIVEEILSRYQQSSQSGLSDEQQAQVDKLVEQKLAAKAKPPMKRAARVFLVLLALWAGWFGYELYTQLYSEYRLLANSVDNLSYSVNNQIDSITNRVEAILKSQNELTADYSAQLLSADLARNTITFSLRAVPKTYVEGMEVVFQADCGGGPIEFPGKLGQGHEFTAEITCPLTDSITLSAVFVSGNTRQTQLLDSYVELRRGSLPQGYVCNLETVLWNASLGKDGKFHIPESYGCVAVVTDSKLGPVDIGDVKLGLFRNYKLIRWLEPCERSDFQNSHGPMPEPSGSTQFFFRLPETGVALEEGESIFFAALITDQYGRQTMAADAPPDIWNGDEIGSPGSGVYDISPYEDPANYTFDPKE